MELGEVYVGFQQKGGWALDRVPGEMVTAHRVQEMLGKCFQEQGVIPGVVL